MITDILNKILKPTAVIWASFEVLILVLIVNYSINKIVVQSK